MAAVTIGSFYQHVRDRIYQHFNHRSDVSPTEDFCVRLSWKVPTTPRGIRAKDQNVIIACGPARSECNDVIVEEDERFHLIVEWEYASSTRLEQIKATLIVSEPNEAKLYDPGESEPEIESDEEVLLSQHHPINNWPSLQFAHKTEAELLFYSRDLATTGTIIWKYVFTTEWMTQDDGWRTLIAGTSGGFVQLFDNKDFSIELKIPQSIMLSKLLYKIVVDFWKTGPFVKVEEPAAVENLRKRQADFECDEDASYRYKVQCIDRIFHVDKATLAYVSPVFKACFSYGNRNMTENKQNVYKLDSYSAEVVEQFLLFCYMETAPDMEKYAEQLLELGHKFDIVSLVKGCEVVLLKIIFNSDQRKLHDVLRLAELAVRYNSDLLLLAIHIALCEMQEEWTAATCQIFAGFLVAEPDFAAKRYAVVAKVNAVPCRDDHQCAKIHGAVQVVE